MKQLSLKKLIKLKYVLLFLCLQLISCEKAPIRSDVEGFWRLERYTVLSTDETVECNRLYYSITRLVTVEGLRNYGINSREETKFRIIGCDGKTMTLESDYARLELRKF